MNPQQPNSLLIIAEQNEILAQNSDGQRRASPRQFLSERYRLPVPAHQLTCRGAAIGFGQKLVLFFADHQDLPRRSQPRFQVARIQNFS
jgi:hypothetical protein